MLRLVQWIETEQSRRPPFETVAAYFLPRALWAVNCGTWWTEEKWSAWSNTATRRTRRGGKRGISQPPADAPKPKRARKSTVTANGETMPQASAAKTRARRKPAKTADNDVQKRPTNRPPNTHIELQSRAKTEFGSNALAVGGDWRGGQRETSNAPSSRSSDTNATEHFSAMDIDDFSDADVGGNRTKGLDVVPSPMSRETSMNSFDVLLLPSSHSQSALESIDTTADDVSHNLSHVTTQALVSRAEVLRDRGRVGKARAWELWG